MDWAQAHQLRLSLLAFGLPAEICHGPNPDTWAVRVPPIDHALVITHALEPAPAFTDREQTALECLRTMYRNGDITP